jgi:L-lactate dehydrogenase complex protein LldF
LSREAGETIPPDIPTLTKQARKRLRSQFLQAGMGISGANLGVAESGSVVLVTNEGNGRMVTSLPRLHVVVMGIEKIAPTWDEASLWLSLLGRSATGQPMSIYTSVITGPARPEDEDGPQEVHIILLDNRRSTLRGTPYEEVLQCIRCGACLNVCPVYRHAGGHAYNSPYSGPIGVVVSPLLFSLEPYGALPQASSLCGACLEVCPARIDLPRMLLALRADEVRGKVLPLKGRLAESWAARAISRPTGYGFFTGLARFFQRLVARKGRLRLPGLAHYPALAKRSFHQIWHELEEDQP